jgi:soluble lytic murein transglycosylase-like protein
MRNRTELVSWTCALLAAGALTIAQPCRAANAHLTASVNDRGERVYVNDPTPEASAAPRRSRLAKGRHSPNRLRSRTGNGSGPVVVFTAPTTLKVSDLAAPNAPAASVGSDVHRLIEDTAGRFQLDPHLVEAVVQVESGYNPWAQSPKGAQGLMQLIPATAARFGVENVFDPAENLAGGSSYLSYLLNLFDGDLSLSLAAYNAGEGAVLRYSGVPPYAETQNYVRRVSDLYTGGASGGSATASKALRRSGQPLATTQAVPVYRYIDSSGIVHFEQ